MLVPIGFASARVRLVTAFSRIRTFVFDLPFVFVVAVLAVVTAASVFAVLRRQASRATIVAAFKYDDVSFALPASAETALGGPLSAQEIESIKQISRRELDRAFAGLRMRVTQTGEGFWRVDVLQAFRERGPLPNAGQALPLGPLGGVGRVGFVILALGAIKHAPAGAPREIVIEGIGRGIGRAAVHEFAHQILGAVAMDNATDKHSYEYGSFDRAPQYYGDLHWSIAWPELQRKIGR